MNKYIIGIDGMACGMCELHVEEAIEKKVYTKKVKASRCKKQVVVFSELSLEESDFKDILDPTGYRVTSFEKALAVRKWYGWR